MPGDVSDHHQCSGGSGLADHSVSRESELTIFNISELYRVVHVQARRTVSMDPMLIAPMRDPTACDECSSSISVNAVAAATTSRMMAAAPAPAGRPIIWPTTCTAGAHEAAVALGDEGRQPESLQRATVSPRVVTVSSRHNAYRLCGAVCRCCGRSRSRCCFVRVRGADRSYPQAEATRRVRVAGTVGRYSRAQEVLLFRTLTVVYLAVAISTLWQVLDARDRRHW